MSKKKYEKLLKKFASVLSEGRSGKAGEIFQRILELREIDGKKKTLEFLEPRDEEEEMIPEDSIVAEFEAIKGVGPELAIELEDRFGTIEDFKKAPSDDIVNIPGIGETKAEKLLEEVE